MPERAPIPGKVALARSVLRVAGGLALATAAVALGIILYGSLVLGLTREEHALLGSAILGSLGVLIAVGSILAGTAAFLVAAAISRRRTWGRVGGLVLGGLLLLLLPVGTVLGVFVLTGLGGAEAGSWFGGPVRNRPPLRAAGTGR